MNDDIYFYWVFQINDQQILFSQKRKVGYAQEVIFWNPDSCYFHCFTSFPEQVVTKFEKAGKFKVTLLSAPVSSELPFCKTTLLRKQLISPILFGRSKIGKKDIFVLHGPGNRKICKSQCFR